MNTKTAGKRAAAPKDIRIGVSPNMAQILNDLRVTLLVSVYDAGALMVLRAVGDRLQLQAKRVDRAMGIAVNGNRLALGTRHRIVEMSNMPVLGQHVADRVAGMPVPDACYVPLNTHVTGEIDIHEMAWAGDELWFVNTRFSCLCTRDPVHSFVPRWRPRFVAKMRADDRCHLNGLAIHGGRPAYVTAFAATDEPEGWRPHKSSSGIVLDVASGEVVAGGLSMPHSPRIYRDELWVQESGRGAIGRVDRATGKVDTVATLPGFTRGLDFAGDYAFVGLSKVRESKSFGGTPLTDQIDVDRRFCGVQVVDLKSGRAEAFLQFESGVDEVFAVQVLPEIRFPAFLEDNDPLVGAAYLLSPDALAMMD